MTLSGRFWAEEGTVYFHNAWTLPWLEALLRPEMGYLSLIANVSALAAHWLVPLESAPHITMLIALAVQALPVVMLCAARDEWLQRPSILLAASLLLALPAGCDEVWLNTANSQFHFAVAAALCLVLQVPIGRVGRLSRDMLLLVAPLCSPITGALLPLFLARAILTSDRGRAVQTACLLVGCLVQFFEFYYPMQNRGHPMGASVLICIVFAKNLLLPVLGAQSGELIADKAQIMLTHGVHPFWDILVCLIIFVAFASAVIVKRRDRPEALWFSLAACSLAVLSYFGALGLHSALVDTMTNNRYAFGPNSLGALGILSLIQRKINRMTVASSVAVVWLLAIGFQDYVDPHMPTLIAGPSWADGVRGWRADPSVPIPIWPPGWYVKL